MYTQWPRKSGDLLLLFFSIYKIAIIKKKKKKNNKFSHVLPASCMCACACKDGVIGDCGSGIGDV